MIPQDIIDFFWSRVLKTENCWIWFGETNEGYGSFKRDKKYYAHRISYHIHKSDPIGKFVCHTCDNRLCVNPEHLFLSDHHGNQQDKFAKERQAKGEDCGTVVLKREQISQIKNLLRIGITQGRIAKIFGVKQPTISDIHRGVTWKHVS